MRSFLLASLRTGAALLILASTTCKAAPYVPASDAVVLETLPYRVFGKPGAPSQAARPVLPGFEPSLEASKLDQPDPEAAVRQARQYLEEARERGDPRFAGYALAALRPWRDAINANTPVPPAVLLMQATLDQYQHDFDTARTRIQRLLQAAAAPAIAAQAWLTLATINRVQGRYAESDRACNGLGRYSSSYALACLAENTGLRGQTDAARKALQEGLRGLREDDLDTRRWLLTTLAELAEYGGQAEHAGPLYRQALASMNNKAPDSYLLFTAADFQLAQGHPREALRLLASQPEPASDGVLLRRAIAEKNLGLPQASQSAAQLAERFEAARLRGDAAGKHGRELARFQLQVQGDVKAALQSAQSNLRVQKEPADWLVLAQAAVAAQDPAVLRELRRGLSQQGLVDARIERLLKQTAPRS